MSTPWWQFWKTERKLSPEAWNKLNITIGKDTQGNDEVRYGYAGHRDSGLFDGFSQAEVAFIIENLKLDWCVTYPPTLTEIKTMHEAIADKLLKTKCSRERLGLIKQQAYASLDRNKLERELRDLELWQRRIIGVTNDLIYATRFDIRWVDVSVTIQKIKNKAEQTVSIR